MTNITHLDSLGGCDVWQEGENLLHCYGIIHGVADRPTGKSITQIEVHSNLQDDFHDAGIFPPNAKRCVTLVIRWRYVVRYMFETYWFVSPNGKWSVCMSAKFQRLIRPHQCLERNYAYSQKISFGFRDIVNLSALGESAGQWDIQPHQSGSTLPSTPDDFKGRLMASDTPEASIREPDISDYAGDDYVATGSAGHNIAGFINFGDYLKRIFSNFPSFPNTVAPPGVYALKDSIDGVRSAFSGLDYTVMMPGGEAFFYNGLDCDSSGNLYSHLTYKKGSSGASRTREGTS